VACEWSNTVRDAFLRRGHDAYSCDLQRADHPNPNFRRHIRGDVRPLLKEQWDLVIAHPPCTYLCNSGVRWIGPSGNLERYKLMIEGVKFFIECYWANAPRVAIENPIHHCYAKEFIPPPNQTIQPWQFGEPKTKATCLWLRGLPPLSPTSIVEVTQDTQPCGIASWYSNGTSKERSRTFQGIADAMADQWGSL
jgi:hypothetical protein